MQISGALSSGTTDARARDSARTVIVDCTDPARQDLVAYWVRRAGYDVCEGIAAADSSGQAAGILVTDRFGPGLADEIVPGDVKMVRPGLRVVVIGSGTAGELAQLSLARVAGADATLATPLQRDDLLGALRHW